jgi:hypothetical protein
MNPEDFNYFQSRVSRFITGTSSRSRFGFSSAPKITRLSSIVPKRALPSQIFSRPSASADDSIETSGKGISSLGRVTFDLEVINNNLDRIRQVIEQDYKNSQETNKKEAEDYRKRIANRGRIFGKRELGDKKSDVLGSLKKYVGSFFSGTGGAIRALATFKLLQGLLSGDPSKIIGPLIGIGLTYLPAIATGIAGAVATSLVGKIFGGGAAKAAASAAPAAASNVPKMGKFGRFAAGAALVGGGLALANSLFNRPQENTQQQRLEELTQEQKGLVNPQNLVPIPQDDLKRFENLNKRFEAALDFLLGKQREEGTQPQGSTQSPGAGPGPSPTNPNIVGGPGIEGLASFVGGAETGGRYDAYNKDGGSGDPTLLQTNISDLRSYMNRNHPNSSGAVGAYQFMPETAAGLATELGLDPTRTKFTPDVQKQLHMYHLNKLGYSDYVSGKMSKEEFGKNIAQQYRAVPDPRTGFTYSDSAASRNRAQVTNAQFLQALEASKTGAVPGAPASPILPSAAQINAAVRQERNIPAPQPQGPNVTLVPMNIGGDSAPSSAASGGNSTVPSINTTYPDNFLAMYSRLLYQVV